MKYSLLIFIDGWCPYCKRFGKWIAKKDRKNLILIRDIRIDEDPRIDKVEALKRMASIDENEEVYYGFKSITLIVKYLPYIKILYPLFYMLDIAKVGGFLYDELAVRRNIIPLHCEDKDCLSK